MVGSAIQISYFLVYVQMVKPHIHAGVLVTWTGDKISCMDTKEIHIWIIAIHLTMNIIEANYIILCQLQVTNPTQVHECSEWIFSQWT